MSTVTSLHTYTHTHTHTHTHTLSDPDLLSLLDGAHGVWLKLQLFRAAQFPVENDNDEDDHKNRNHNSYDQPHVTGLSLRGRQGQLLHRWNRVSWYLAQKNHAFALLKSVLKTRFLRPWHIKSIYFIKTSGMKIVKTNWSTWFIFKMESNWYFIYGLYPQSLLTNLFWGCFANVIIKFWQCYSWMFRTSRFFLIMC